MTVPFLKEFRDRFTGILQSQEPARSNRLTILRNDMAEVYGIKTEYDHLHFEVMHLYRAAGRAREGK